MLLANLLFGLLAIGGGASAFLYLASLKQPPAERPRVEKIYNVEVFAADRYDLQEVITGYGTVRADRDVRLSAEVAGTIVEVHPRLKIGERVDAAGISTGPAGESVRGTGDTLVRIDPQVYVDRVAQAKSQLETISAEVGRLQQEEMNNERVLAQVRDDVKTFTSEFQRIQGLARNQVASQSQVARAQLELRAYEQALTRAENEHALLPLRLEEAKSRKAAAQTELKLAERDLERTEVRPPFSGMLSDVAVELGQFVGVGDTIVRLTDLSVVEIPVSITLSDYAKLRPLFDEGRLLRAQLAGNETESPRWSGEVVRISPEADDRSRTIYIFIRVDNRTQPVPLLPGMFVHARIDGPVLNDTLAIPRDAILNGRLFVANSENVSIRRPNVLRTLQSLAIIESGVEAGDQVILTNLDVLFDKAKVQVQSVRTLSEEIASQRTKVVRQVSADDRRSR